MADVVAPGNLAQWLAPFAAADRLALLVRGELRLAPHLHAARLGSLPALACARPDKVPLELGDMRCTAYRR
jgi:hypothetical protein